VNVFRCCSSLKYLLPVVLLSIQTNTVSAQDDFAAWKRKTQTEFETYLSEQDKAFVAFLAKQWQSVETQTPRFVDTQPKPVVLPTAPKPSSFPVKANPSSATDGPELPALQKPHKVVKPLQPQPPVTPPTPVQPVAPALSKEGKSINIVFYGHKLAFYYDKGLHLKETNRLNSDKAIAHHYQALATTQYSSFVDALINTKQALHLNDWSYALLVHKVAGMIEPQSASQRTLLTWFLCLKSGYAARVAYDRQGIVLLLPSKQPLFGETYFSLSGAIYYALNLKIEGSASKPYKLSPGRKLYTYQGSYPSANNAIDFSQSSTVDWIRMTDQSKVKQQERSFTYANTNIRLSYQYLPEWVSYLNTLPQMDLPYYFSASLPAKTAESLLDQLSSAVKDRETLDAVNLLLRFVQKGFPYQTDAQQFHQENYLFPIETLHYPYSDCEDRAVLFAWLVRKLLGLEVVILDYPGHVATAVALADGPVSGQFVYQKRRFWVADPTYINAQVGQSMPAFHQVKPKILTYEPLP
jgi:hypothetical protein